VHRGDSGTDDDGADEAAEKRVRGAGRQPEKPGHEVPDNCAEQPGEDDRNRNQLIIEKTTGDRFRNLGGEARAD
jgi:hypothetical protein